MNVTLWVLQLLLALHTAMGAIWKFTNSEQSLPTMKAIPHGAWMAMSVVELLCALGLVVAVFNRRLASLAAIAAGIVAAEMLLFTAVHLASGSTDRGPIVYWLVVAALCSFIVYGRTVLNPR